MYNRLPAACQVSAIQVQPPPIEHLLVLVQYIEPQSPRFFSMVLEAVSGTVLAESGLAEGTPGGTTNISSLLATSLAAMRSPASIFARSLVLNIELSPKITTTS